MNIQAHLAELERMTYGDEGYEERHTPQLCVFVREDGRMLYSGVRELADVTNREYEGEIYKLVRETFVMGDFLDGKRDMKKVMEYLWQVGVCEEEIRAIINDLTERKNSDGTPRRDNTSHVTYKQPLKREYKGRKVYTFLAK